MRNNTDSIQKVFSRKIALELRNRGFDIVDTEPNFYKPKFDVYLFKDTNELQLALSDINRK